MPVSLVFVTGTLTERRTFVFWNRMDAKWEATMNRRNFLGLLACVPGLPSVLELFRAYGAREEPRGDGLPMAKKVHVIHADDPNPSYDFAEMICYTSTAAGGVEINFVGGDRFISEGREDIYIGSPDFIESANLRHGWVTFPSTLEVSAGPLNPDGSIPMFGGRNAMKECSSP